MCSHQIRESVLFLSNFRAKETRILCRFNLFMAKNAPLSAILAHVKCSEKFQ